MTWFLVVFLSVYTGLHAILYSSARHVLPSGAAPRVLLCLWFALMILGPVITVLAYRWGLPRASALMGTVAYWWMGFLFLSLLCLLALLVARLFSLPFFSGAWNHRIAVALALGAAFILTAYAGWAATQVRLVRVELPSAKLPAGVERLTLAVTSDLHLGLPGGKGRLERALKLVRGARPDLWVDAGDMWDRPLLYAPELVRMMAAVKPPLGKYAVGGNHENYVGLATCMHLAQEAGFVFLLDRGQPVGQALNLAGVIDVHGFDARRDAQALAHLDPSRYTVFLRHRPEFNPATRGRIDLQISGHTHGGQIWPFHYVVKAIFPLFQGLHDLGAGTRAYTTRGSGTWGPPLRFLAPPEVTIITLKHSQAR